MTRLKEYLKKHINRSNLGVGVSVLTMFGPDILNQFNLITQPWLRYITIPLGYVVALCVKGKAVILLDLFYKKEEPKNPQP
jgi:hypothetical protein